MENGWRVRKGTGCLWDDEAASLRAMELKVHMLPRPVVGKDYRVNGNLTILLFREYYSPQLLYIKGMDGVWESVMVASS